MRTGPGFWNYPQFNPYARGVPGATPPFVPTQGMPPMGMPPMGMPQAPSAPQMKGPAWLQKFAGGMDKFMGGLAGGANPYLAPQEQAADAQRRKMAMIAALIQSSGPVPKNSQGLLAPFGAAIQAGQEAGDQFSADAIRQRLAAAQMTQAQNIPGANSRFGSPQVMESGRVAALDRQTGRYQYTDDGTLVPTTDRASADLQIITLPDGSQQLVNMRPNIGSNSQPGAQGGNSPRTEPLVNPETALSGAADKVATESESRITAEARTQARLALPRIEEQVSSALGYVDKLLNHPGREIMTGTSSIFQPQLIPGSNAKGFAALLEQVKGGVFLDAYQALKGGGTITEIEGAKAESAKARLETAQSEQDFIDALNDYKAALSRGLELARAAANGGEIPASPMNGPGQGVINRGGNSSGTVNWDDL